MKICSSCKQSKEDIEFSGRYNYCKKCNTKRTKRIQDEYVEKGLCRLCGKNPPILHRRKCIECTEAAKNRLLKLKLAAFEKYGGSKCSCCGELLLEFLTIDHIDGGGNKHRKSINSTFWYWLRNNNYPEGYRVLCMNCNFSRGIYGYCPHER